jgi:glucosamine--fructose-6-phosphate aminotransferase (isomerizing)
MSLHSEILEQPDCLAGLLKSQRQIVERVAAAIAQRNVPFVLLAARGTSDNAGRYANYLLGAVNRLPLALATPSLFTYYDRPPDLHGALVIGISQSGHSPDIVSVLEEGRRQGCLTLAITNFPGSPLGQAADFVLDIQASPELAVAATKTYTAELMSIAMLSTALQGGTDGWTILEDVPGWVRSTLALEETISAAARRLQAMERCAVVGRGYNYSTVFEWALKLTELAYVQAEPYSSADFQHGPIAMVDKGFPVLAVIVEGKVADSMLPLLQHLRRDLLAELVVVSNLGAPLSLAPAAFRLPAGMPEHISPIVSIVAGQLFAYHLTVAKGFDPEKPRTIIKVTETR